MGFEQLGCAVAHELEGIAAFDEGQVLGQQPLQLDRSYLGAVLLALAALLPLLVAVERAFHPVARAMEQVDGGPEQVFQVGLETGVGQGGDQGAEDVGECRAHRALFRERARIGLVLERAVTVELEFGEERSGRGGGVRRLVEPECLERSGWLCVVRQRLLEQGVVFIARERVQQYFDTEGAYWIDKWGATGKWHGVGQLHQVRTPRFGERLLWR